MAFFESKSAAGSFVVHFTSDPMSDFGIWAEGYAEAAASLAQALLSRTFSADSEVYPAVFLYRHALELYLKAVIIEGSHLNWLKYQAAAEKLSFTHKLPPLVEVVERILSKAFPGDAFVASLVKRLKDITTDWDGIDPESYGFRYPVDKAKVTPVAVPVHMSLVELAGTMDSLLQDLATLDLTLTGEAQAEEEILGMVFSLTP